MADCNAAHRVLCDPATEVSAHYLISESGEVQALVPEEMRAWHAGAGSWGGIQDINSQSIGIELSNTGFAPFAALQMLALETLLHDIMRRWAIPAHRVIGHSDCAPGRKIDPGPRFDWLRLARQGLAIWPAEITLLEPDAGATDIALQTFGYTADVPAETRLGAFRLRFRPHHTGPSDGIDRGLAEHLAARYSAAT